MKRFVFGITGLLLVCLAVVLFTGCSTESTTGLKVVTSTSLLAQITERVGGDKVNVVNIIPPAQCPGHFDVKPGDMQRLADATLFLYHNWQGEKFTDELIASANNKDLKVEIVELAGNWMTPQVQSAASDKIAEILSALDPANKNAYLKSANDYKAAIAAKDSEVKASLANADLPSINVLCDVQQMGFVKWTGLNVVETYGRPDTFTPQVVKELVDKGRANNVTLVIDNMQTGGEAGKSLAEELGVTHLVFSNFPGGYENTETWEKAIDKNIELLLNALDK